MIHLDSLSQNYAHQGPSIISRTRPALTPPPALRPAPPLPVYTSTEYSLPGAPQLSRMRAYICIYEIFSLFLFGNMKITFNHVKHVITFTNLAPPNRSEPSQLDWPRTVLRHFEAFITAPHLRCSVHGKRADTVARAHGSRYGLVWHPPPDCPLLLHFKSNFTRAPVPDVLPPLPPKRLDTTVEEPTGMCSVCCSCIGL